MKLLRYGPPGREKPGLADREGNIRDLTDPLFQEYSFQVPTLSMNRYPTFRVDYQLSQRHRLRQRVQNRLQLTFQPRM